MKIRVRWRDWASAVLGLYLFLTPWIFLGMDEKAASSRNAWGVAACVFAAALWALVRPGSRNAERARVALGAWLLVAPFALGFAGSVASLNAWVTGVLVIALADVVGTASDLETAVQAKSLRYRVRELSPEKIVGYRDSEEPDTPEQLSRRIAERSDQIRRTLLGEPSEAEVEMCALGCSACMDDLITLTLLVNEELPRSGPIRRLRLRVAWRRATDSLSRTREALPPNALCALREKHP